MFAEVEPDPTIPMVEKAVKEMQRFEPDIIIAMGGRTEDEKVELLIKAVEDLDDQCTGANPRFLLISEIKEIYIKAYE